MLRLAAMVLALALFPVTAAAQAPQTPEMVALNLPSVGKVEYNTAVVPSPPDAQRLVGLVAQVERYIATMCSCTVNVTAAQWRIRVVPYAEFEDFILDFLAPIDSEMADGVAGELGLIDGFTYWPAGRAQTYFYQWPSDPLLVHEMMHVAYPLDTEESVRGKTASFLTSRSYKDWLRRSY